MAFFIPGIRALWTSKRAKEFDVDTRAAKKAKSKLRQRR
jgi:hypothetical protein